MSRLSRLQFTSTSSVVALVFFVSLVAVLTAAWISGIPKRPIIYAVAVYIGPSVFILVGLLRSRTMAIYHVAVLLVAGGFSISTFNQAMTTEKQLVFDWFPKFIGLFVTFYIIHLLPERKIPS
jgi:hypothetical protein